MIIIAELEGQALGLIVDKVTDVFTFDSEIIEPPSPLLVNINTAYQLQNRVVYNAHNRH